jgi:hypothetical protein
MRNLLVMLMVISCTSQEEFAQDYSTATCELYEDCEVLLVMGEYETLDECTEIEAAFYDSEELCPAFNPKLRNECLEEILLMTCDDLYTGGWPESCDLICG